MDMILSAPSPLEPLIEKKFFDDLPSSGRTEGLVEAGWTEFHPGVQALARRMLFIAGAFEDLHAPVVSIGYEFDGTPPNSARTRGGWHVDDGAFVVADRGPTQFLSGTIQEASIGYLLEELEVKRGGAILGVEIDMSNDVLNGDTNAFARLISALQCTDNQLRLMGGRIDAVRPRQAFKTGIAVHRPRVNRSNRVLPRKVLSVRAPLYLAEHEAAD
jgi:hypothetical protein